MKENYVVAVQEIEIADIIDCRLYDISIDYYNHRADIFFGDEVNRIISTASKKLTENENRLFSLHFENLLSFSIKCEEPWGAGIYVCDAELVVETDKLQVEIILNSGDKILIECKKPKEDLS